MKNKNLILLALAALAGCDTAEVPKIDQCMRREIFQQCMAALPKGPTSTVSNDWAEVVEACENAAYYQSKRSGQNIKPECKAP